MNIPDEYFGIKGLATITGYIDPFNPYDHISCTIYLNLNNFNLTKETTHKMIGKVLVAYLHEPSPMLLQVKIEDQSGLVGNRGVYYNAIIIGGNCNGTPLAEWKRLPIGYFEANEAIFKKYVLDKTGDS